MSIELQDIRQKYIPGVAVVYAGVGEPVNNVQLLQEFSTKLGWDQNQTEVAQTQIASAGINRRYRVGNSYEGPTKDYKEEVVDTFVALTKSALKTIGWNRADFLVAVNSVPPDEKSEWAKEVAERSKIPSVMEVNATCNGGTLGLVEVINNPDLRNERVIITAYEALSRFISPDDLMSHAIFGSGGASIAFVPNSFNVLDAKTTIRKDTEGVIKVPQSYEITSEVRPDHFPDWFKVEEGSEGIIGRTDRLVRVALPIPTGDPYKMEMDGRRTGLFFSGLVTEAVLEALETQNERDTGNSPIKFIVGHQPSKPVFDHVGKKVAKAIRGDTDRYGLTIPDMPWILDQAEISNISPGTTFIAFAELLNQIRSGDPFMVLGYGVGSSVSRLTLQYKG